MDLTSPINRVPPGRVTIAKNVRAYLDGGFKLRHPLSDPIITVDSSVQSLARMNDTTPAGPGSGFVIITESASGNVYADLTSAATGLSGNPVSMVPFRPNASVQPWMYIGDDAPYPNVTVDSSFNCTGMIKVRSDGLSRKMGIQEPPSAPTVSTAGSTTSGSASLPATTFPWTNVGGANPAYSYGHTSGGDGTSPVIILTPVGSQTLELTITGSATVNGATHAPGDAGPTTNTYPGYFVYPGSGAASANIVLGAFTDGSGNVIAGTAGAPNPVTVGGSVTLTVPSGATRFQLGIDSAGNTFSANSGSFAVNYVLTVSSISTKLSTLGDVTAYVWGDSPHSGPVAEYIWKNPGDGGSGTSRTASTAAVTATNNSWQFDSSPEDGTVPVQWDTLNSAGTVTGSVVLFSPKLEPAGFQDFNAAIVGTLFVPTAGKYTFTFVNKDQIMVGIGGGVTSSAGTPTGSFGQTETVVSALPLVYVSTPSGGGGAVTQNIDITFPGSGSYQIEIDWDYWYHTGRKLVMTVNGAVIPPLASGVRTNVSYAYKYRASETGAQSNPSPTSTPQVTPVLDNTVTPAYSPDPQVDKVDFYRQDNGLANYTYVATGPNTNPPTAIVDSLTDLEVANNQLMTYDDFEPVPSIDLPRSGLCTVSGGIITRTSGDVFNTRWLPGTVILIGQPTQLAYSFISRPISNSTVVIPDVPDGIGLRWNIAEPKLAAQPLAYIWGPTDNINYAFGCGDPYRPGTLYWSKGSNLDSWPDTNQMDVTDPSEALVNGAMSGGLGVLFSIKRAWIILPNFFNALATVTGTSGSTWTLQATYITRGLFMPRCVAVAGGGKIFFRVDDGIHFSEYGLASVSITDDDLYPLFPHESPGNGASAPQPIVRNGITIYPPDDSLPEMQKFAVQNGYLYYTYTGTDGNPHTLVFDSNAGGWIYDEYSLGAQAQTRNIVPVMGGNWDTPSNALSPTVYTDFIAASPIPPNLDYPVPPAPGEQVAWSTPPISTGFAHISRMGPMAFPLNTATLSIGGFTMPAVPAGSTITHIYVVARETYFSTATPPVLYVNTPPMGENSYPISPINAIYYKEIMASDIPTLVKNQQLVATSSTGPGYLSDPIDATWTIVNIGIAVYYIAPPAADALLTATVTLTSLPYDAVITGVKAAWQAYNTSGTATSTVDMQISGVDGTAYPLSWPGSVGTNSHGGPGDLWGWTAPEVGGGFTIVWRGPNSGNSYLRHLVITIYFTGSVVGLVITFGPNEGESVQGVLVGCVDGSIRMLEPNGTETVTGTVLTPGIGGTGWMTAYEYTVEYKSSAAVTLTSIAADTGNGSYAPVAVTLPSTSGIPTKYTFKVSPNKWKMMWLQFQSKDPAMEIYLEGFVIQAKPWGSQNPFVPLQPFSTSGGMGAQVNP
jgi:hypothetical protein